MVITPHDNSPSLCTLFISTFLKNSCSYYSNVLQSIFSLLVCRLHVVFILISCCIPLFLSSSLSNFLICICTCNWISVFCVKTILVKRMNIEMYYFWDVFWEHVNCFAFSWLHWKNFWMIYGLHANAVSHK